MPIINKKVGFVDAVSPDLRKFKAHGGKLLLYAGWSDTTITPENTVLYYENLVKEMGEQKDFARLFMVPGMAHCRGGDGPNTFDTLTAMEQWREQGVTPTQMMGTNPQSGLSVRSARIRIREVQGRRRSQGREELGVHGALASNSQTRNSPTPQQNADC